VDGFGGGRRWCRIWPMSIKTTEKRRVSALSETCSNVRISVCELSFVFQTMQSSEFVDLSADGHLLFPRLNPERWPILSLQLKAFVLIWSLR